MNFDRVKQGIILASEHKNHPRVTRQELLRVTRRLNLFEFTPLEADVVYRIFDTDKDGLISLKDYDRIVSTMPGLIFTPEFGPTTKKTTLQHLKESVFHFVGLHSRRHWCRHGVSHRFGQNEDAKPTVYERKRKNL